MSSGDFKGNPFQVPRIVIKVRDGPIPNSTMDKLMKFLNSGNKVFIVNHRGLNQKANIGLVAPNHMMRGKRGNWFETIRTGILQEVSVNMPYIGLKAKDEVGFFSMLETALKYAKEIVKTKKELIEKAMFENRILPFFLQGNPDEPYFEIDYAPSILNLVGLESAIYSFKGLNILKDEDGFLFAEKVLSFVKNKLQNFVEEGIFIQLANLESKNVLERFSKLNYKNFGVKDVYYNTHTIGTDLMDWAKVERDLQAYSDAGNYFEVSITKFANENKKDPSIKLLYDILDTCPRSFVLTK